MKTLAYYPIHYGAEYLGYSMHSIRNDVDHIVVFYSSTPTYGHIGNIPNPDSKEDIQKICNDYGAELIDITNKKISRENNHRELGHLYARENNYDIVIAVDYDEVWENLEEAVEYASSGAAFSYGIRGSRWYHFWKNFNEVNRDGFSPIRIFNMHNRRSGEELIEKGTIYHFGYAISEKLMRYKLSCHGHKSEFPGNWLNDKWINYAKGLTNTLHPATDAYWIETEYFHKEQLPEFMRLHPTYQL